MLKIQVYKQRQNMKPRNYNCSNLLLEKNVLVIYVDFFLKIRGWRVRLKNILRSLEQFIYKKIAM